MKANVAMDSQPVQTQVDLKSLGQALVPGSVLNAATSAIQSASNAAKAVVSNGSSSSGQPAPAVHHSMAATAKVFAAVQGHWLSACIGVMLQLRIADILVANTQQSSTANTVSNGTAEALAGVHVHSQQDDALSIDQLAEAAKANKHHLYKVLRVLAQYEMLDELPGKRFKPNIATRELVQGEQPSLGHMASHLINKPKWDAWKMLPEAVQQGKTAFVLAHGMDVYQFGELPEQSAFGDEFCKAMSYFTRHSLQGGKTSLKDAYDWKSARVIVDVGGGRGELLSAVMSWAGQQTKGAILDRQMVIDSIDIPNMFEAKGVQDAASRLTLVVGDVREPFPQQLHELKVGSMGIMYCTEAPVTSSPELVAKWHA
eukprot:GHRR01032334.1.p1 GENE.GHRR01032334.1~~GHRR01032334.1.p1  ORF type:complete len:371 (+),score=126.55 GHRR01032334.1:187-1299(+)